MMFDRKRHALRVGPAPEPSDVVWENLEFSVMQRLQRSFFILLLNLLIILVGQLLPLCACPLQMA